LANCFGELLGELLGELHGEAPDSADPTLTRPPTGGTADLAPGAGAWAGYDAVPQPRARPRGLHGRDGGNFPRRLRHRAGAAEVVEWPAGRAALGRTGLVVLTLPLVLPAQFTLAFDLARASNPKHVYLDGRTAAYASAPAARASNWPSH
jgi:hypothetical protein